MLDYRAYELIIVENLKAYLSTAGRPCEVIRQNQVAKIPAYPYVSYTSTTPASGNGVPSYSQTRDGTLYRSMLQTWSFTVQSDDQEEAITLAYRIYDFFSAAGLTLLSDNSITVRRVGGISSRDNLITVQYEYRNGLDVTFGLLYSIKPGDMVTRDEIDTNEFNILKEDN